MTDHDPLCPKSDYEQARQLLCECDLIADVRADERAQYQGRRDDMMRALSEELLNVRTKTLTDLRAKVEALGMYSTFGPDGSLDGSDVVLRSDVLDLIDGGDHHGNA